MFQRWNLKSLASVIAMLLTGTAHGGSHTWRVSEVFSTPDGSIQFIELRECCGGQFETGVTGHPLTSNSRSFTIPGPSLTAPTSFKSLLFATQSFANLPGAPTPNYIIPPNFFNPAGDTIRYVPWHSATFGAGMLPTDCVHSLNFNPPNGQVTVACNTPTNYAGQWTYVRACGCCPTWRVSEVFTTSDGLIQFIELRETAGDANMGGLNGQTVQSNGSGFVIPGPPLAGSTANKSVLLATQSFAALAGAPTPDYIIPPQFFNPAGDNISFSVWDSIGFTTPAPSDCTTGLTRTRGVFCAGTLGTLAPAANSPTNFAGQSGQVNACPAPECIGDVTGGGTVNIDDLVIVITSWGACQAPCSQNCSADVNDDCLVNIDDLVLVVTNWGECR